MSSTSVPVLVLRPAGRADAYAFWVWANDPETRRASHNRPPIPWSEHVQWLDRVLGENRIRALMAEGPDGCPVGWVRIETNDEWSSAWVSYVIAPEARGHGLGGAMLSLGVRAAIADRPDLMLFAKVVDDNPKSLHLFRRLGWDESVTGDVIRFARRPGGVR